MLKALRGVCNWFWNSLTLIPTPLHDLHKVKWYNQLRDRYFFLCWILMSVLSLASLRKEKKTKMIISACLVESVQTLLLKFGSQTKFESRYFFEGQFFIHNVLSSWLILKQEYRKTLHFLLKYCFIQRNDRSVRFEMPKRNLSPLFVS